MLSMNTEWISTEYYSDFRNLDPESIKKALHALLSNKKPASAKSYSPEFVRLVPPVMPVDDEVISWIFIDKMI